MEIVTHYGEYAWDKKCPTCKKEMDDTPHSEIVWYCRNCKMLFKSDHHGGIYSFKIPEFVRVRGCENCDVFKFQLHEEYLSPVTLNQCRDIGCTAHGYSIEEPYIDPQRLSHVIPARLVKKRFLDIKEKFEESYAKIGIQIDKIMAFLFPPMKDEDLEPLKKWRRLFD